MVSPLEDGHDKCVLCLGFQHVFLPDEAPEFCLNCFLLPPWTRKAAAQVEGEHAGPWGGPPCGEAAEPQSLELPGRLSGLRLVSNSNTAAATLPSRSPMFSHDSLPASLLRHLSGRMGAVIGLAQWASCHNKMLELQSAVLALQHFLTWLCGFHVIVRTDSMVAYINQQHLETGRQAVGVGSTPTPLPQGG